MKIDKIKIGCPVIVKRDIKYGQGNLYKGYEAVIEYIDKNAPTKAYPDELRFCQIKYNHLEYWILIEDIDIDLKKIRSEKLKNIIDV